MTIETLTTLPAWARPIYGENPVLPINRGDVPLWSGKGEPPAIGSTVELAGPDSMTATVEGYQVLAGWLMVIGTRCDGRKGNLAGREIK